MVKDKILNVKSITKNLDDIQLLSKELQGKYDINNSLIWMTEELGEVISAIRKGHDKDDICGEIGDLFAWVISICNILDINLQDAINKTYRKELLRQINKYGKLKYASTPIQFDDEIFK